jgi:lysophospholipase L1-like esterase
VKLKGLVAALWLAGIAAGSDPHWVTTWSASMAGSAANPPIFSNQTVREIVHISAGGESVRVRFSNAFGSQPLMIGSAHVALCALGSIVRPGSDRALKFDGQQSTSILSGGSVFSDPVQLKLTPLQDLAVSIYLPNVTPATSVHWSARQTSYVADGDRTGLSVMWPKDTITFWPFLAGVEVAGGEAVDAIVTLGDSITDGAASTMDSNRRWPNVLAERLLAENRRRPLAVVNAGIGGNRILHNGAGPSGPEFGPSALARFGRDVLAQPGVKYVVVLEGINDLGHPGVAAPLSETVSAGEIISGLQQLIVRAHAKGLRIFGGTLLPFEGATAPGYYTSEREAARQSVNQWIRTSKAFDSVIDFDKAVRDPSHPARLLRRYDSGDHVHPNDAGYKAMGEFVDLSLF